MRDRAARSGARRFRSFISGGGMSNPRPAPSQIDTCDECAKLNVGPCPHVKSGPSITQGVRP